LRENVIVFAKNVIFRGQAYGQQELAMAIIVMRRDEDHGVGPPSGGPRQAVKRMLSISADVAWACAYLACGTLFIHLIGLLIPVEASQVALDILICPNKLLLSYSHIPTAVGCIYLEAGIIIT
jgi:hypothetical protein